MNIDPVKLDAYATHLDPFPLLNAINGAAGQGTNFVTMPGPGTPPAPTPGTSFGTMLGSIPPAAAAGAPALNPQMLSMLMGAMQQPPVPTPPAMAPRPGPQLNLGAMPANTAPSFSSFLRRG